MHSLAVVDTNVLVSALMKPGSLPAAVVQSIRHGTLVPVVCVPVVEEYRAVLRRPRLALTLRDVTELIGLIEKQARWVRITPYLEALKLPDVDDWPFIASALAADCPVITGNARHFPARTGVQALTARKWLDAREAVG